MDYAIVAVGKTNPIVHAFEDGKNVPVCGRTIRVNAQMHCFTVLPTFPDWFLNRCEQCVPLVNGTD